MDEVLLSPMIASTFARAKGASLHALDLRLQQRATTGALPRFERHSPCPHTRLQPCRSRPQHSSGFSRACGNERSNSAPRSGARSSRNFIVTAWLA